MRVRTLIADDDARERRLLSAALEAEGEFEVVAECTCGRDAAAAFGENRPDLALLEIDLPDMSGFDLLELIPPQGRPITVFVSTEEAHAARAFDYGPADFLLKPVRPERLRQAMAQIHARLDCSENARLSRQMRRMLSDLGHQPAYDDRLAVRTDHGGFAFLKVEAIEWIDAAGKFVRLNTRAGAHLMRETMRSLEGRLDPSRFVRIHRSTIVNLNHVAEIRPREHGDHLVILDRGQRLNLSRSYRSKLPTLLGGHTLEPASPERREARLRTSVRAASL